MRKIAAVTGSRRGIGFEIARQLGLSGYHVIMSGVSKAEDTKEILDTLKQEGIEAEYVSCNIADDTQRNEFINYIKKTYGRLDVHVNNAGVAPLVRLDLLETTRDSFEYVIDTNLKGTFFMTQLAANLMIAGVKQGLKQYSPRIINISSISSFTSSINRAEYCISKSGISMITKLFADRLSEFGIPVFEVQPGFIRTDMTKAVIEKYESLIQDGITPIKRMGEPIDVANCVMTLISGSLDFATGQVLHPDGGFHIRRL